MNAQQIKQIIADKITDKIEPRHNEKGHFYYFKDSGHLVSSVTGKLGILSKPHLTKWAVKMGALWLVEDFSRLNRLADEKWREAMINGMQLAHTDVRDAAGATGNFAHDAIERGINEWIFTGVMPEDFTAFARPNCDPRATASIRAVQKLFKEKDIVPLASEILVGDHRYSAGTLDFLCLWEGKLCIVDWKTSNQVSQEYILQAVAYLKFFEHMTGLKVKKVKILHLSKDSDKYTIYNIRNINKAWRAFKQVCGVYAWRQDKSSVLEKDIKKITI